MTAREKWIFAPLIFMTILLGIYPALVLDITGPAVSGLVDAMQPVLEAARGVAQAVAE